MLSWVKDDLTACYGRWEPTLILQWEGHSTLGEPRLVIGLSNDQTLGWNQCHARFFGSGDLLRPTLALKNEQWRRSSDGKSRWVWALMGNQSSSLLRWEQVPLQWSQGSDGEGGEEKRHRGGEIKCNRVEKTKEKFDHVPTGHRTETWPTPTGSTECRKLNFHLKLKTSTLYKHRYLCKVSELCGSPNVLQTTWQYWNIEFHPFYKATFSLDVKEMGLCVILWTDDKYILPCKHFDYSLCQLQSFR